MSFNLASTQALANATLATQALGTAASAYGAYQQSVQQRRGFEYQAAVQGNNAKLAGWQAQDALDRGRTAEQQTRLRTANLKGTQRAALAANGVDLGSGSALDLLTGTDVMGEIDAGTVRTNAQNEAWALRQQARGYSADAALLRSRARAENPLAAAGSTLLTGATGVASNWYLMRSAGAKV